VLAYKWSIAPVDRPPCAFAAEAAVQASRGPKAALVAATRPRSGTVSVRVASSSGTAPSADLAVQVVDSLQASPAALRLFNLESNVRGVAVSGGSGLFAAALDPAGLASLALKDGTVLVKPGKAGHGTLSLRDSCAIPLEALDVSLTVFDVSAVEVSGEPLVQIGQVVEGMHLPANARRGAAVLSSGPSPALLFSRCLFLSEGAPAVCVCVSLCVSLCVGGWRLTLTGFASSVCLLGGPGGPLCRIAGHGRRADRRCRGRRRY
jgi:hypothetical protein